MWRRRRLPLSSQLFGVLALVLGTAAFTVVRSAQERYEALLPAAGPAVRVVVAAAPIPRGAVVQDAWIEVRQVPRAFAAPGWVGSPADVVGRVLVADVVAGEPITRARLAPSGAGPLAAQVPDGLRAVALPAAVPPGLEAGDRVDVLATYVERGYTEPVGAGLEAAGGRPPPPPPPPPPPRPTRRPALGRRADDARGRPAPGHRGRGRAPHALGGRSRRARAAAPAAEPRIAWAPSRGEGSAVTIWQAIILGLTQGITEFAPISSSGHLILVPWLFGWSIVDDPALNKTFDVALHVGTLMGALAYFRADVWRYAKAFVSSIRHRRIATVDERLAWALVVGTIPGALVGALLEDPIQEHLGAPWLIAVMLAAFGVLLYAVDRVARRTRDLGSIGVGTGLFLGVAQALALQPGVSRSGVTMTAARAIGLDRESAARFSFLLAMPIIFGAGVFKGLTDLEGGLQGFGAQFAWGIASSAVSGFLVIWFLLRYLRTHDYRIFLLYRLAAAALVLGVIAAGIREATI